MSGTDYKKWKRNQEAWQLEVWKAGKFQGHFSTYMPVTARLAARLGRVDGPLLDVGCGALPLPAYLAQCRYLIGIDPLPLSSWRRFPAARAMGEDLPFQSGIFAGVALMSVLDHTWQPARVLSEAWRVLRPGGEVFVWFISRPKGDKHHRAGTLEDIADLLAGTGFEIAERYTYDGNRDWGYPRTHMLVGVK